MVLSVIPNARGVEPASHQKSVTVLGSTGSIGCNTIDLIERSPERFTVRALTANRNVTLLAEQARRLQASLAVVADENCYGLLKEALAGTGIEVAAGRQAVIEAAGVESYFVMAGIVGAAGLEPTLAAVRRGTAVGLANKECLVSAGELFMREVKDSGAKLLPVDSEHNAIYQIFDFDNAEDVEKVILTASGGPFRDWTKQQMEQATPDQAVAHPNWSMGAKISVDSATMMNKGLELIEAHHLFPVAVDQIDILIHPQSVVHSLVSYIDGSVLAQMGTPDMRTPIAYALAWPARIPTPSPRLNLADIGKLTFEEPDPERFPAISIAREALLNGGCRACVMNAVNEVAVASFLNSGIGFLDIARVVTGVLEEMSPCNVENLQDVYFIDKKSRSLADALIKSKFLHI